MNLEELVNQKYSLLTANDREMLTAVFSNKQKVREMNSTQLSSYLHVSRTTLVRLMKKLGIDTPEAFQDEPGCRMQDTCRIQKGIWYGCRDTHYNDP